MRRKPNPALEGSAQTVALVFKTPTMAEVESGRAYTSVSVPATAGTYEPQDCEEFWLISRDVGEVDELVLAQAQMDNRANATSDFIAVLP
jgi:hypothetical protein